MALFAVARSLIALRVGQSVQDIEHRGWCGPLSGLNGRQKDGIRRKAEDLLARC